MTTNDHAEATPAERQPESQSPTDPPEWADEEFQIAQAIEDLSYMPHPGRPDEIDVPLPALSRRPFAERLYRKGWRYFPEHRQLETVIVGEDAMGACAAARTIGFDEAQLWNLLRAKDPDLYQRIRDAEGDQEKLFAIAGEIGPKTGRDIARIMTMLEQVQGARP